MLPPSVQLGSGSFDGQEGLTVIIAGKMPDTEEVSVNCRCDMRVACEEDFVRIAAAVLYECWLKLRLAAQASGKSPPTLGTFTERVYDVADVGGRRAEP